jgi:hypothetical protein
MDSRTVHAHVGSGHSLRTGADGAGAVGVRGPRLGLFAAGVGLVVFVPVTCTCGVRILTVPTRVTFFFMVCFCSAGGALAGAPAGF